MWLWRGVEEPATSISELSIVVRGQTDFHCSNAALTVCFETENCLFSPLVGEIATFVKLNHLPTSKQTVKVQFSLDMLGKTLILLPSCIIYYFLPRKGQ